jgi:hypothetical protein
MRRFPEFVKVGFVFSFLLASLVWAADLPSGESLIARSVEKSGGAANFAKIRNSVMTGKVDFTGHNLVGTVAIYTEGDRNYTVIELPGLGKIEEGFDGKVAWEMNAIAGPRIKEGDEKSAAARAARMNSLANWNEYYKSARTIGEEVIDGHPAWKVEMQPLEGAPETGFFDKESGLLVRSREVVSTALGDISAETILGDYRPVGGVLAPFSLTEKAVNQTIEMRFENIAWNTAIPPGRFDLPPAIQALTQK